MDSETRDTFWHAVADSPFIMVGLAGHAPHPMTAMLDRDAHHAVWFFTTRSGPLGAGGAAESVYVSQGHKVFATLSGTLTEETDRATFEKHWSNPVEAWFPGGRADPDLLFLRYDIADAEVWTVDKTASGLFHLLTGKPVKPHEMGDHATGRV